MGGGGKTYLAVAHPQERRKEDSRTQTFVLFPGKEGSRAAAHAKAGQK